MPLIISRDAPKDGPSFIASDLEENRSVPLPAPLDSIADKYAVAPWPIRKYALQLDRVQDGCSLDAALPGPWLYFLVPDKGGLSFRAIEPVGGVELFDSSSWDAMHVGSISVGPIYAELSTRLTDAAAKFEREGGYEPRLLNIPALELRALWCHKSASAEDWLLPLAGSLDVHAKAYWSQADDFMNRLQSLAKAAAKDDSATLPVTEHHRGTHS